MYLFNLYFISWKYVGLKDCWNLVKAVILSELFIFILFKGLNPPPNAFVGLYEFFSFEDFKRFPRSIFIIDGFTSILLFFTLRISKRVFLEVFSLNIHQKQKQTARD